MWHPEAGFDGAPAHTLTPSRWWGPAAVLSANGVWTTSETRWMGEYTIGARFTTANIEEYENICAWQSTADANDGWRLQYRNGTSARFTYGAVAEYTLALPDATVGDPVELWLTGTASAIRSWVSLAGAALVAGDTISPGTLSGTPAVFLVGRGGQAAWAQWWRGQLVDVLLWHRALSEDEIRALYDPAVRWDLYASV